MTIELKLRKDRFSAGFASLADGSTLCPLSFNDIASRHHLQYAADTTKLPLLGPTGRPVH
jgi:hypothetical protein